MPTTFPLAAAPSARQTETNSPPPSTSWPRALLMWTLIFLALGIGWRTFRYVSQFPIWGDEAYVALNLLEQSYWGLMQEQKYAQAAPLLFLWSELTVYHWLGGSELALRLLPFLAGLAALLVFWRLARAALEPLAAVLATGIMAVAYYPVRHACEVKPYSFDLLMSAALMLLAAAWLRRPERYWPLVGLCLFIVPALGFSNPTVFVAGGVSLALLPVLLRRTNRTAWILWGVYNLLLVGGFLMYLQINIGMQTAETQEYLAWYWREAFPPGEPLVLVKWLASIHTGHLMAYPVGGKNGVSIVTFLLFLVGAAALWRSRRFDLLLLCLIPFGLTFLAAVMHRYPYGLSARVSQHLAPAVCLLAALGVTTLLGARRSCGASPARQRRCLLAGGVVLALVAVAGIARDIIQPFKTPSDIQCRQVIRQITSQTAEHTPIIVLNDARALLPEVTWYLHYLHQPIVASSDTDWERLGREGDEVVCLFLTQNEPPASDPPIPLQDSARPWQLVQRELHLRPLEPSWGTTEYFLVLRWQCK